MLAPSSRAMLLRAAMRAGGAVCCAKRVGSVLGSGLAAPTLFHAASVAVPSVINLQHLLLSQEPMNIDVLVWCTTDARAPDPARIRPHARIWRMKIQAPDSGNPGPGSHRIRAPELKAPKTAQMCSLRR